MDEEAICAVCGDPYLKRSKARKHPPGARIHKPVRGAHTKTCSKKCSLEFIHRDRSSSYKTSSTSEVRSK